jgi:maltose alpha-D-glucosyltransferase/alpha-amylase
VIQEGPYGYDHVNAAAQRRDPDSLLNWTERIIRMRKEVPEIGWGRFELVATGDPSVLAMCYEWRNNSVLFVHNLGAAPREISLTLETPDDSGRLLVNLLSEDHSHADADGRHRLMLERYGYRWYRVGGLDYLLKRSDIDDDPP